MNRVSSKYVPSESASDIPPRDVLPSPQGLLALLQMIFASAETKSNRESVPTLLAHDCTFNTNTEFYNALFRNKSSHNSFPQPGRKHRLQKKSMQQTRNTIQAITQLQL